MWSFRGWRRRRIMARHPVPDGQWRQAWERLPLLAGLTDQESRRLRELALLFIHEKSLEGAQGLELDDHRRLLIGLQACLPILNLSLDWYRGWVSVIVYPDAFVPVRHWTDEAGVEHTSREPLTGESWHQGPVVLAWPDVEEGGILDGHNLVIHEFAHKLDLLAEGANGHPPLHRDMAPAAWTRTFQAAFDQLRGELQQGHRSFLDPYGAENPAEFFAVVSERFFETPNQLEAHRPGLYAQLRAFYRQDPAARLDV